MPSVLEIAACDILSLFPNEDPLWSEDLRGYLKYGHTLLHLAILIGWFEMAALLVRKGAPLHLRSDYGRTALDFRSEHKRRRCLCSVALPFERR